MMTPEVLKQKTDELNERIKNIGGGLVNNNYKTLPHPEYMEKMVLYCIDDINSVLLYNLKDGMSAQEILTLQDGDQYDFLAEYKDVLGRDYVLSLIEDQIADIDHIERDVWDFTCTRNIIVWKTKT